MIKYKPEMIDFFYRYKKGDEFLLIFMIWVSSP
ncbi:hypothetical protein LYNGBM3L_38660 [Moorena producens 3L]|uniref:Uncharacterized protein n=1 Tax=Moorena producens 3L TaxID=489825 RepID=F4XVG4_9CYAN|nr:hypothetical protein LYNGBM3L_38660 [Moorena producens 3L]